MKYLAHLRTLGKNQMDQSQIVPLIDIYLEYNMEEAFQECSFMLYGYGISYVCDDFQSEFSSLSAFLRN
jgi:hypothetical protein